jgi:hypothetical protein
MPRNPSARRCSALNPDGQPCRAWAVRGSEPPLCSAHGGHNVGAGAPPGNQNRRTHGFYSTAFDPGEVDRVLDDDGFFHLDGEIACARIALRRVLAYLASDDLSPLDYVKVASLAFQGVRTVARLLRDNQALGGQPSSELQAAIDAALDELGAEWGIDL